MVNLSGNFLFILASNFQFRLLHYCVRRKCCLLCKRIYSLCPRKEIVIIGWLNSISIGNCVVSYSWLSMLRLEEILKVYQQCQICCFNHVLSIYQSKGNSQSFMYYQFATTCIYVKSSLAEFSLVV